MIDPTPLRGLRNGQNTDLSKGTIRNADAVLLLLAANGSAARISHIKAALQEWRPGPGYGYLFQLYVPRSDNGYGFLGSSFEQAYTEVGHAPRNWHLDYSKTPHKSRRRNYYYRPHRGVVAISAEGFRRLAELGRG